MARKNRSALELLVLLPWWVSAILAALSYVVLSAIAAQPPGGTNLWGIIRGMAPGIKTFVPLFFCIFALLSAFRSLRVWMTLKSQSGIDSLREVPWKEFEDLVAEVFRRQGFSVKETLGGGADGGIDLVLYKDGQSTLVQCKRWKERPVGVTTVRELFGVIHAEHAIGGILVSTSHFTPDALEFAKGKPLRLIDGRELASLVKSVQSSRSVPASKPSLPLAEVEPICPRCGAKLVLRTAGRGANAGAKFYGCASFPRCRHTQPA